MPDREFALLTADDLVTGEAVALDLPPASLGARMASGLIDVAVTVLALIILIVVFTVATIRTDQALVGAAITTVTVLVFVIYPTTLETLTRGRSLGKLALGLRTVRDDAGPISFQHALLRSLIGFVEVFVAFGVPAFFSMLVSSRGKRLGDFAAGTYVVRERVRLTLPHPPAMPPRLHSWATGADVTSLPTGLALAVRQYLGRLDTLDPDARYRVGCQLAERVRAHVAPPPPSGTPPEEFLMAVVATRRERDLARMRRQAQTRERITTTR